MILAVLIVNSGAVVAVIVFISRLVDRLVTLVWGTMHLQTKVQNAHLRSNFARTDSVQEIAL